MKILFYLEPWIEMGRPEFRFGSFKGYLNDELKSLVESGADVTVIVGEGVSSAIKMAGINVDGLDIKTIRQKHLQRIFPNYKVASDKIYHGRINDIQQSNLNKLIIDTVGDCQPDVVLGWETPLNFFKKIYPNALILHSTYGMFSRSPFPEMQMYDFEGLFLNGFYSKNKEYVKSIKIEKDDADRLSAIRKKYHEKIKEKNPFSKMDFKNSGEFEFTVLLPLQVSGYFSFDSNCNFINQFDYLKFVLDQISPKIRVVVTEHSSWSSIFTTENLAYFRRKYPNFFYHERFSHYKFCSQLLMPYIDSVLTVSSSVGLLGLFFERPIFTLGESHMSNFSSGRKVNLIYEVLKNKKYRDYNAVIFNMLFKWNLFMREDCHSSGWLYNYFSQYIKNIRLGLDDPFPVINSKDKIQSRLMKKADLYKGPSYIGPNKSRKLVESSLRGVINDEIDFSDINKDKNIIEDLEKRLYQRIKSSEVVGFDVFDTLLIRKVAQPKDVFELIRSRLIDEIGLDVVDFSEKRILSEKKARELNDSDEITLKDIYIQFFNIEGLDGYLLDQFINIEENVEYEIAQPREIILKAFNFAKSKSKKILIVTDIYHSKKFIERLLNKINVSGYDDLIVSSDVGLQKHSGRLFDLLISDYIDGEKYLHVGDNPKSDFSRPKEKGLDAFLFPSQLSLINKSKRLKNSLPSDTYHRAEMHRLLVDKRKWSPLGSSVASGEPFYLGYLCLGPLLLGFSEWLYLNSIKKGITKLHFLSREGQIFKRIFDAYQDKIEGVRIETQYVYCSRRSVNVASIENYEDAIRIALAPSSERTVEDFLVNRFGFSKKDIEEVSLNIIASGFENSGEVFHPKRNQSRVEKLIKSILTKILSISKKEKEALVDYYEEVGIANKSTAVVDIGYKGTMQSSIEKLLNVCSTTGFYLITFLAAKNIKSKNSEMNGFLGDYIDHTLKGHDFCNYIPVVEFMLLADHPSFKKISVTRKGRQFVFQSGIREKERERLVSSLQMGAVDYVVDYAGKFSLDSVQAYQPLGRFLRNPDYLDSLIFCDHALEDNYGGNNSRFICSKNESLENVWVEGSAKLQNIKIVRSSRNKKKIKKLMESPFNFFNDSHYGILRPLRHIFNR